MGKGLAVLSEFILAVNDAAAAGDSPVETNDDNGCFPDCSPCVKVLIEGNPETLGILFPVTPFNRLLGLLNAPLSEEPAPINAPPDNKPETELDPEVAVLI